MVTAITSQTRARTVATDDNTPLDAVERQLVRTLLRAVRRTRKAGIDAERAWFKVRVSPRSGGSSAMIEAPEDAFA